MKSILGLNRNDPTQAGREALVAASLGFAYTQALATCVKAGICERLLAGPLSVSALAEQCRAQVNPLRELLAILADLHVVRVSGQTVTLGDTGRLLLADEPHSLRDWIVYAAEFCAPAWANIGSTLIQEAAPPKWQGRIYDALEVGAYDPGTFHRAMHDAQDEVADAMVRSLRLRGDECVADVGCGQTNVLVRLLHQFPNLRGIAFDKFADLEGLRAKAAAMGHGVAERLTCIRGDFLEPLPFRADVILIKNVLADWSDANISKILANAARALEPGGRILVATTFKKAAPTASQAIVSLNLRVLTEGGDRTLADIERLATGVGLKRSSSKATTRAVQLMEFRAAR